MLSAEELAGFRGALAQNRRPKVVFTDAAGQIAGQVGQVVRLADPAASDEFVVVRFGRDELPFSPADLAVAPRGAASRGSASRGAAARKAAGAVAGPDGEPAKAPEFVLDKPVPAPRASSPAARPGRAGSSPVPPAGSTGDPATGSSAVSAPGPSAPAAGSPGGPASGSPDVSAPGSSAGPAGGKGRKPARPKPPAGLTVTLAYADGEWTVSAQQGARVLAKPYLVRPAEALRMVGLVDVPGVQEAVEQILAVERAEAEQQAQRLRAELAEIEARLAELRDAG